MQAVPKMPEMPKMKEMPKMQEMPKAEEIKGWKKMLEKSIVIVKKKA
ncbi:hypothetical protein JMA_23230 [Jeotgalibacillus malaysiensis]|uniref:Uncharacterized protein n=1 Tax=Jeotgalibacillus malaysiensis TaxID=1508404 RepID=A0A0B5AMX0_9BACL|nr:hypothetical protein [Jeotgalibacillus malaysiensis]AJD91640.1 hypothetical protein JMA_23230 [Jeotgalibacillus malaysiensis]